MNLYNIGYKDVVQKHFPNRFFRLLYVNLWKSLEPNFKSVHTTSKFKQNVRANLFKVSNYYRYMLGSRKCNIIHTRLRHQCSSLGADLFRVNIVNDLSCPYECPLEDAIHYLLECPLYTNARMQLFMNITPYTVISITLLVGNPAGTPGYRNGTESFFGLKGRPSVVRDV